MESKELKKDISLIGAFSTVMGTVIGAGIFFKTANVAEAAGSPIVTLLAWFIGGMLTLCAGLTTAELGTAIPKTGGAVKYVEYTYGPLTGFLLGWAQSVVYFPANIAALSIIFSAQLLHLFHLGADYTVPVALLTATSVTCINLLGTKIASRFQSVSLFIKLIPIGLIISVGLICGGSETSLFSASSNTGSVSFLTGLSGALVATLFAYDGWLGVGAVAGEMKHPERELPKAISLGLLFITCVYVLINWVFLKSIPFEQIQGNPHVSFDVAQQLFGHLGGKLITIGILLSVYGALNGYTMTGIRVPYALGKEGSLPFSASFSRLSRTYHVPYVAALGQLVIALIMITMGSFDLLTDMIVFVIWGFSVLLFMAVFILRKREPHLHRPYKVPLYPVIPIIAILGGVFILIHTMKTEPLLAMIGLMLTLAGIPVYWLGKKQPNNNKKNY